MSILDRQPSWLQRVRLGLAAILTPLMLLSACEPVVNEELVKVYPREINDELVNPDQGWTFIDLAMNVDDFPDAGRNGTRPYMHNVYLLTTWAEIETEPGNYDWTLLDQLFDYWSSQGKSIDFRISTDTMLTGKDYSRGVPEWLYDKYGVPYQERYEWDGRVIRFPDYTHPIYQEKLNSFLQAFASHYKDRPELGTVDLRGYGTWGEWHSGHDFASMDERIHTLRGIIDAWYEAWEGKKVLLLSNSFEYRQELQPAVYRPQNMAEYQSWSAFDYALTKPYLGFRRDGIAGSMREYDTRFLVDLFRSGRRTPIVGEFFHDYSGYQKGDQGYDNAYSALNEALFKFHLNYSTTMGWERGELRTWEQDPEFIRYGNRMMGYRFVLHQAAYPTAVAPGGTFTLHQTWSNQAVGRSYKRYPLKVYLFDKENREVWSSVDTQFNQTGFVKGEVYDWQSKFTIGADLPEGSYDVRIAMVDEATEEAAIALGIDGNDGHKRYSLGRLEVRGKPVLEQVAAQQAQEMDGPKHKTQVAKRAEDASVLVTNPDQQPLEAGGTYRISFAYSSQKHLGANNNSESESDSESFDPISYTFHAVTETGGSSHDQGMMRWYDLPDQRGVKTVLLKLGNFSDYRLQWESEPGEPITIEDLVITKIEDVIYEGFEPGSSADKPRNQNQPSDTQSGTSQGAFLIEKGQSITTDTEQVISGGHSFAAFSREIGDTQVLESSTSHLQLKPNKTYTVSFRYKPLQDAGTGGYYYMTARTDKGGEAEERGFQAWREDLTDWTRPLFSDLGSGELPPQQLAISKTFMFTTGNYDDYRLIFGIHNSGAFAMDDLIIQEH